jgi:hypothetical protein
MAAYPYLPDLVRFLEERFDFRFGFADPEGKELSMEVRSIDEQEFRAALLQHAEAILLQLEFRRRRRLEVFIGGPMNGRRHNRWSPVGALIIVRVARTGPARWAVYRVGDDHGRAFFQGYATSKARGRKLQLIEKTKG